MSAASYRKTSSQFNPPPAKRLRLSTPHFQPETRTTSDNEDPYATANLANTLEQLQNEASAQQKRREQADCVRRTSILFDVFGYVVILPRLQTEYTGPLTIKDWHDDVRALLQCSF
jgi:peptide subunit release factor RF-3